MTFCQEGDREPMDRLGFRYIDKGMYISLNFQLFLSITQAYPNNIITESNVSRLANTSCCNDYR